MRYNLYSTEQVRQFFFEDFARSVHEGDCQKINYVVWRQIRDALNNAPSSALCYFFVYDRTECEDAKDLDHCILMVVPTIDGDVFSFNSHDHSFGFYLWGNVDISSLSTYGNIPFDIKDAIEKAHNDGVITLHYEAMPYTGSISKTTTKSKSINIDNKEEKNNMFNFDFGPCTHDNIRISMYGIAVKNANGNYASYDKVKKEIVDVDILNFEGGKYLYKMPVAIKDIKVGDVIFHNGKPVIVTTCTSDIVAVDVFASEKKIVMPIRNMFGFDFVSKIVSLFDFMPNNTKPTADNPFGTNPMLLTMMLGNKDNKGYDKDNSILETFALASVMGGNNFNSNVFNPMMLLLMDDKGNDNLLTMFALSSMMGNNIIGSNNITEPIVNLPKDLDNID